MSPIELTKEQARRIAIAGQLLTADRPRTLVETLQGLCSMQLDQTSAIAPSADLVAWSRLGDAYRPEQMHDGVAMERTLFEYRNLLYPMSDLPLYRPVMAAWPDGESGWHQRLRSWMKVNDRFRRYILTELERSGPLQAKDLDDRSVEPWASTGWNNNRNVPLMLEFMEARGEIAVTARERRQRLWDIAWRVYPESTELVDPDEAAQQRQARRMRWLGIAREKVAEGAGTPTVVEGTAGNWRVDPDALDALDRPFEGRTAMLSPFDRLVQNRERLRDLFDFDYCLEMYLPAAKRRWGYYALPVLHHERFIGAVDAKADHKTSTLRVLTISVEPHTGFEELHAIDDEIASLASWLGLATITRP
jgi:uncharacterized protein YcaQ